MAATKRKRFVAGEEVRHERHGQGRVVMSEGQLIGHSDLSDNAECFFIGNGGVLIVNVSELHHGHVEWIDDD